jgi:hypothetical protein
MKITCHLLILILCTHLLCVSVSADEATLKQLTSELQNALDETKLGPLGYRIESTDFEKEPDRQIVVTMSAAGEIQEIRARLSEQNDLAEWSLIYREGLPVVAQLKKWRKITIQDEQAGEALTLVETFLPKKGVFEISNHTAKRQLDDVISYAENKRVEQAGTGQPATRSQSKSEGSDKPQPESEGRSR